MNSTHGATAAILFGLTLATAVRAAPGPETRDPAKVPAGAYVLDKGHASLTARIGHMGFSNYTLRFDKLDASFDYNPAAPAATKVNVTVDPASIDTGNDKFNRELAGTGWLEADKFATITFVSSAINPGVDGKGTMAGDLTLHGVTTPVTLDVTFNGSGPGFPSGTRAGFSAVGHVKRSDFGISKYLPLLSDNIDLAIEVEFTKQ